MSVLDLYCWVFLPLCLVCWFVSHPKVCPMVQFQFIHLWRTGASETTLWMFISRLYQETGVFYICGTSIKVHGMILWCILNQMWHSCGGPCAFQEIGRIPHPLGMQLSPSSSIYEKGGYECAEQFSNLKCWKIKCLPLVWTSVLFEVLLCHSGPLEPSKMYRSNLNIQSLLSQ